MNKILAIVIGILIIAGVGWLVTSQSASQTPTPPATQDGGNQNNATTTDTTSGTGTGSGTTAGQYTAAEVATHNSVSSCWSIIDGNVYDLTAWIPQHPGGEQAILSLCGVDGTTAFHNQHGTRAQQANILATFKIGVLAQ